MKYIFAVSGGPDSMAMLDMFKRKALAVCVVNYNKRHDSSKDVEIVVKYCKEHNIKYYVKEIDKKFYESYQNVNFQALAREIRYTFFAEIAKIERNNHIFVAHNLNDDLETAHMQFARDSKSLFYGIRPKNEVFGLKIKRPVIRLKKQTLLRYCEERGINYAIDSSNELDIYERNKVRKLINSWNNDQLIEFRKKVRKFNKQNKKNDKLIVKNFKKWCDLGFDLNFWMKFTNEQKYYLVYEFLKFHLEKNNNRNKVNAIIEFLLKASQNRQYRLENNKFLIIADNKLVIKK